MSPINRGLILFCMTLAAGCSSHRSGGVTFSPAHYPLQYERMHLIERRLYQGIVEQRPVLMRSLLQDPVALNDSLISREEMVDVLLRLGEDAPEPRIASPSIIEAIEFDGIGLIPIVRDGSVHDENPTDRGQETGPAFLESPSADPVVVKISIEIDTLCTVLGSTQPGNICRVSLARSTLSVDTLKSLTLLQPLYDKGLEHSASGLLNESGENAIIQDTSGGDFAGLTYIHRPIFLADPGATPRLTKRIANSMLGVDLFSWNSGAGANALSHTGVGVDCRDEFFVLDRSWNRIVYGHILSGAFIRAKAYGPAFPTVQHKIPGAVSLCTDNGQADSGNTTRVFLAEGWSGRGRLSRLDYSYSADQLTYSDSLTIDADGLYNLSDVAFNDAGTPENSSDDWVWATEEDRGRILKFNAAGPGGVIEEYGQRDEVNPELSTLYEPLAVVCGRAMDATGVNSNLVYVIDRRWVYADPAHWWRIVCLRDDAGGMSQEAEWYFPLFWVPSGMTADGHGAIHVIGSTPNLDPETAWIIKFDADLRILKLHQPPQFSDDGIYRPKDISNPQSSAQFRYGDLFVTEEWGDSTGAQWFLMGSEVTDFAAKRYPLSPANVTVSWTATDALLAEIIVYRSSGTSWDSLASYYPPVSPPGLSAGRLILTDGGTSSRYRFLLVFESLYRTAGEPVNSDVAATYSD